MKTDIMGLIGRLKRCSNLSAISKSIIALAFLLFSGIVYSQETFNMGVSGHQEVTSDHCIIYDDGGPTGNYSTRVDASYTVRATNPDYRFKVHIKSHLSNWNSSKAKLTIRAGEENSTVSLQSVSGVEYYIFYADTNVVTLEFHADDDNPAQGFEVEITAADCAPVTNLTCEYTDSVTAVLRWNGDYDNYTIIYMQTYNTNYYNYELAPPNNPIDTVYSTVDSVALTISPNASISYHVYGICASGMQSEGVFGYECSNIRPQNLTYEMGADSLRIEWDDEENVNWWYMYNSSWTLIDTSYLAFLKECNTYYSVDVVGTRSILPPVSYCNERYIWTDTYCDNVNGMNIRNVTDSSITIWWRDNPDIDEYVIGYRKANSNTTIYCDTVPQGIEEYTIYDLAEATEYIVCIYALCDDCGLSQGSCWEITTTLKNCLDFTNIRGMDTYLTWGTYDNPYSNTTYNGYRSDGTNDHFQYTYTRHAVCVDTTAKDSRTNYQLRKIPVGEKASVRLGNEYVGAEAESISYEYTVDSTDKDMLILKYAVVLQDPDHNLTNQPRFRLEILDENNQLIDSTCGMADFFASGDLGWNTVPGNNSNTIWKDWTTIGIDIAPYHGTTIRVRLTTYDCQEGGHFGYAYFTLNCDNKKIYLVNRCDAQDSIDLVAPLGFDYKWYKEGEEDNILSTEYNVTVPIDSNNYHCRASFVDKPECYFIISTVAINVLPHSELTYTIDSCVSEITFNDLSYLEFDTSYGAYTQQMINNTYWIFEDGTINDSATVTRYYPDNGMYEVRLVSDLTNSNCVDTMTVPISIAFNAAHIIAPDVACQLDTVQLVAETLPGITLENPTYQWNTTDMTQTITQIQQETFEYTVSVKDNGSCMGLAKKSITVNPSYFDTIYADICQGYVYDDGTFNETTDGMYFSPLQTTFGCDSLTVLVLTVHPTFDTTIVDSVCAGVGYDFHGATLYQPGTYVDTLQTVHGCDSVVTLNLFVAPVYEYTISAEICEGQTYAQLGFEETQTGLYTQSLQNQYGCDSIVHLDLVVNPVYDYVIPAEICQGTSYTENDFNENQTGSYTRHLQTYEGCDSIVTLDLLVNPIYNDTIFAQMCGEAYRDFDFDESETGIYTQFLQTASGCDSVVTLNLIVWEPFIDTIDEVIYRGTTYEGYGFSESEDGEYVNVYTDIHGCDSTYVLQLNVVKLMFPNMVSANGDGINEVFEIHGLLDSDFFHYNELTISTRHGRIVYHKENIAKEEDFWSPADTESPAGTYFFQFRAKGKDRWINFNGTIEVFRQ